MMGMDMEIAIKLETKMKTLTAVGGAPLITSGECISRLLLEGIFQRGERVALWGGEALFPKRISSWRATLPPSPFPEGGSLPRGRPISPSPFLEGGPLPGERPSPVPSRRAALSPSHFPEGGSLLGGQPWRVTS